MLSKRVHITALVLLAIAIVGGLAALAGVGTLGHRKAVVVGVSIPAASSGWIAGVEYWAARASIELGGKHSNIRVIVKSAHSVSEQTAHINDLHASDDINTLVILPIESEPLTGPVAALKRKGVFVTVVDRGLMDTGAQDAYVGGDNTGFGKVAADYLAASMGGKGNVVFLRGVPCVVDTQRVEAFTSVLETHRDIKILDSRVGHWSRDGAYRAMQELLAHYPQIDAVWAADDDMAEGAQRAIDEAHRTDIKFVIGGGGSKASIRRIMFRDRLFTADVTYSPMMISDAMRLTIEDRLGVKALPATTIIPSVLVTRMNAREHYFPESPY